MHNIPGYLLEWAVCFYCLKWCFLVWVVEHCVADTAGILVPIVQYPDHIRANKIVPSHSQLFCVFEVTQTVMGLLKDCFFCVAGDY